MTSASLTPAACLHLRGSEGGIFGGFSSAVTHTGLSGISLRAPCSPSVPAPEVPGEFASCHCHPGCCGCLGIILQTPQSSQILP